MRRKLSLDRRYAFASGMFARSLSEIVRTPRRPARISRKSASACASRITMRSESSSARLPASASVSLKCSLIHVQDSDETSGLPVTCAAEEANFEMRMLRSPFPNISVSGTSASA